MQCVSCRRWRGRRREPRDRRRRRSLSRGRVVREGEKKGQRVPVFSSRCRVCRTCVVPCRRRFGSLCSERNGSNALSLSCYPPSPPPSLPPSVFCASRALSSLVPRHDGATSPRPDNAGVSGDYCCSASGGSGKVAADASPPPPPRANGVPVVVSRRERKGNGRDGRRNGGVNDAWSRRYCRCSIVLRYVVLE